MSGYIVRPSGAEWHISSTSSEEIYTYRKKSAAVSMAESLASSDDSILIYRFDNECLQSIK
jgi:hypothetical protein